MGGRGAGSGVRGNTSGENRGGRLKPLPLAGQTAFDENGRNLGVKATLDQWEDRNKALDHEQLLMVNSETGYAVAYFDGDKTSVAFEVPKGIKKSKISLTHVHPAYYDRTIGGTFSDADLLNHIRLGLGETRAVSVEGTYVFRAMKGANANGFTKALARRDQEVSSAIRKMASGKELTGKQYTDLWLKAHDTWLKTNATNNGYYYKLEKK